MGERRDEQGHSWRKKSGNICSRWLGRPTKSNERHMAGKICKAEPAQTK